MNRHSSRHPLNLPLERPPLESAEKFTRRSENEVAQFYELESNCSSRSTSIRERRPCLKKGVRLKMVLSGIKSAGLRLGPGFDRATDLLPHSPSTLQDKHMFEA
jgi:hypothetical protein